MTAAPALEPHQVPPFVKTPADLERWTLCVAVTRQLSGGQDDPMFAQLMFFDASIPTYPPDLDEAFHPEEPRNRLGKWMSGMERGLEPMKPAPDHGLSAEELAEKGFDQWPEKGGIATEVLGDAYDTQILHRPEGDLSHLPHEMRYPEDRIKAVHDPIVHALTDGHASQTEPHVLIVAGGPASGKTTFLRRAKLSLPPDAVELNADDIAFGGGPHHGIPEGVDMLDAKDPYAAVGTHREAGDIFEKAEQAAVARKQNIVMDLTGNGELGEFERQLQRLKDAGYKVDMLYVSTPTEKAVRNSIHRAVTEGRYVPSPVVRDKHRRVAENFQHIAASGRVDSVRVYDPEYGLVAFRNEDGAMEPTHEEGYARWMAKAKEPRVDVPDQSRTSGGIQEAAMAGQLDRGKVVIGVPFELESREAAHKAADEAAARAAARKRP